MLFFLLELGLNVVLIWFCTLVYFVREDPEIVVTINQQMRVLPRDYFDMKHACAA